MDILVLILMLLLSSMLVLVSTGIGVKAQEADSPLVNITSPNPCENIPGPKEIIVQGTASDQGSGIEKVEAFAHTLPFNNQFPYELAEQINNNWSNWKIKLSVPENEPYRISARVTDMEGNENWDEVTITTRPEIAPETDDTKMRVAFIHPTFTSTAYSPDSFYTFYPKYESVSETTDDIGLLDTELNLEENRTYYQPFIDSFSKYLPHASVSILRDQDVHNNAIFLADNQTNAFDAVALLHNEYVTEKEYYNLKKFVENGGSLILIDGNVFYAEVSYDPTNCSIQLVEGHDWVITNGTAKKGPHERWLKENKEWIGSNFLYGDIAEPVKFMNNPFNYTRFEENYISNNNATILLDYLAEIPANVLRDNNLTTTPPVATYELSVGKGKVVAVGLYGQNLAFNDQFLDFFKKTVIQHALGSNKVFDYAGNKFVIYWNAPGNISDISIDKASKSISLTYMSPVNGRNLSSGNSLALSLPRKLIDSPDRFGVTVNNQVLGVNASSNGVENILDIPVNPGHNAITIKGKAITPSFSVMPPSDIVVNATGKETHLKLSPPTVKNIQAENYSITNDAPETFPSGDTLVNWTVTQDGEIAYEQQKITILDNLSPSINITSPNPCEDIPGPNEIIVQGIASDQGSGIAKVEAFAHTLPFNNQFPYELAEQINNNWSNWKIKLSIPENEPYRISARVTDMEGNENWDEVIIGVPTDKCKNNIP